MHQDNPVPPKFMISPIDHVRKLSFRHRRDLCSVASPGAGGCRQVCLVQPCPYALLHCRCPLQRLRQPSHASSILRLPVLVIPTLRELGPVGFLPLLHT